MRSLTAERKVPDIAAAAAPALPDLSSAPGPLALWHRLSLDAPTVATVWLVFVARIARTPLPAALPLAMFLAVWLIYACDRLLDGHQLHQPESPHTFHQRHRLAFIIAAVLALSGITVLLPAIPTVLLSPYLLLATLLCGWLLLIHFTALVLPKHFAPGFFFAAAIFLPEFVALPAAAVLLPALGFAALCTLNCLLIRFWREHPQPAPAPHLRAFTLSLALLPLLLPSPCFHAISLSAAALLALAEHRSHLRPATLRAAADLALLTPLLFLHSLQ